MKTTTTLLLAASCLALATGACGSKKTEGEGDTPGTDKGAEAQIINIDGSSTVFPITAAVAEEFQKQGKARVTVGFSGTGGGFKKFCRGETAMSGASRPIKDSEREKCAAANIEWVELPVAYDGLAVVVSKDNDWVDHLTVDELRKMWSPESQKAGITRWSQIRDGWPDEEFKLFGPGTDSGTFDYFTKAINGEEQKSRTDFSPNEDDNILVQGVSSDKLALGYFGYAYYQENTDKLKLVPIDDGKPDNGAGPIAPSVETVAQGTYQPLSRPIFVYVSVAAAKRPEVDAFVKYYLGPESQKLVTEVGYIPLPPATYAKVADRYEKRVTGSLFEDGSKVGVTLDELLAGGE